jgi:biopolymer transport protein TolQ
VNFDANILNYFFHAGLVVKCVMLILISASILSWAYILQRTFFLKDVSKSSSNFEKAFWSGEDLSRLYNESVREQTDGSEAIFHAGFKEFLRFRKQQGASPKQIIENTQRAMRVAQMRQQDKMELTLPFLAIVGSTSPYVGLFGTVWGIMQAVGALGNAQQATLSMVAPGIAEALIATAIGLFAAIPASIAYSRFITDINRLISRFDAFQEEFVNVLTRQLQHTAHVQAAAFTQASAAASAAEQSNVMHSEPVEV